ncbi:tyrosine-protein phosphatase [Pseudaquidulcibacter saccharophilus]|uniref:tyrosine-protein phosphatase n=1 Tax=Pseudaquidulcibacter saccharophilus TaxID=2831900 RepID=UPI001EFF39BC|nr:tyrosine-protein phosphatase [Pseudaquidulcibacter saccharophilus]
MHRFIKIDGVHNFRDFGKYKTKTGEKVREKLLFRSGQLSNLTENGHAELSQLKIKTIVDLRKTNERKLQPNQIKGTIKQITGSSKSDDGETLPPHLQYLRDEEVTTQKTHDFMLQTYRRLPYEPMHVEIFNQAFAELTQPEHPILIHCAAGKDRTGILCALILKTLDVHDDDIMDDYLLTNKVHNLDELVEKYAESISNRLGKKIDSKAMRPLGIVSEEYLQTAFDEIINKNGSLLGYLNAIGIKENQLLQIRKNLI